VTDLQKPNSKQASEGSLAGQLKGALSKWLRNEVDDMVPARVVTYDDTTNRATIQPLVMVGTTGGQKISRASLPNIPVFRFGGGGFFMRFPIKPGDFGWLKANDRDISLVLQAGGGEDWPNTERLHDFSDAMFFPDTVKGWLIDGANVDAAIWQSMDGSVCISLHGDKVDIKAPHLVATLDSSAEITAPNITLNGTTTINGTTAINGGSLTHNGTNVGDTHIHPGVMAGPATTGTPQ
jgi:hypothetical protein